MKKLKHPYSLNMSDCNYHTYSIRVLAYLIRKRKNIPDILKERRRYNFIVKTMTSNPIKN